MIRRFLITFVALPPALSIGSAFASFGRTPGQLAVSSNGSVQYEVSIWAPPRPRGIQPSIALLYP